MNSLTRRSEHLEAQAAAGPDAHRWAAGLTEDQHNQVAAFLLADARAVSIIEQIADHQHGPPSRMLARLTDADLDYLADALEPPFPTIS